MYYARVAIGVLFGVLLFAFLDYALPSQNVVRISNTYNRLTNIPASSSIFWAADSTGTVENARGQRDVRFMDTVRPNGKVFVYRNEDTGWVWPPYFKYDSANLQAEATNLQSTGADPIWVNVTAYGWRVAPMSIYPNAISINTVAGPDARPANWPAMVICGALLALLLLIWRMLVQFRKTGLARFRRGRT